MLLKQSLLIFCLFAYVTAFPKPKEKKDKARIYYNKALQFKAKRRVETATLILKNIIKKHPNFPDAYSTLGEWYFEDHKFQLASNVFGKGMINCHSHAKAFAKPFAKCLVNNNKPDSALLIINEYALASANMEWEALRQQAMFVRDAIANRWKDSARNMGPRINTISPEMFPTLSADSQVLYFTRRHNNMDEDFYYALPDSCGGWFTALNMGNPPNTSDQESSQMISADGHYLFFTRCENRSENGWGQGGCDLFMCYRADTVWSAPESFGATINTPNFEGTPSLSADNRELYFCSDRPGGYGGFDIYVSRFEEGLWQVPVNLGPTINTPGNETSPYLHIDGKTLYFSSDGHPGMGGKDLFISRKINDTGWTKPVNMGYPINSTVDDNSVTVTLDGKKIYFSSDRDSVAGNYDLYEMRLPKELQPTPVSYMKGYVYDSLSKDRLNYTSISINETKTNKNLYRFMSNRGDASFMITLPVGVKYTYLVERIGYNDISGTLVFDKQLLQKPMEKNFVMLPEDYVAPIKDSLVLTIYFPLNGSKLSDTDIAAISKALEPWATEKGIVIFVSGYTDNTGTPILNEQLSAQRAALVTKEIKKKGFDDLMIRSQGYGEARAKADNSTEEGRNKNRRVEVMIRR